MEKIKVLSLERLIELFEDVPDPWRPGGNIQHKLVDLLVIILLGVISSCETWIGGSIRRKAKRDAMLNDYAEMILMLGDQL